MLQRFKLYLLSVLLVATLWLQALCPVLQNEQLGVRGQQLVHASGLLVAADDLAYGWLFNAVLIRYWLDLHVVNDMLVYDVDSLARCQPLPVVSVTLRHKPVEVTALSRLCGPALPNQPAPLNLFLTSWFQSESEICVWFLLLTTKERLGLILLGVRLQRQVRSRGIVDVLAEIVCFRNGWVALDVVASGSVAETSGEFGGLMSLDHMYVYRYFVFK